MTAFVSSFFQAGIEVSSYHIVTQKVYYFSISFTLLTLSVSTFGMDLEKRNKKRIIHMGSNVWNIQMDTNIKTKLFCAINFNFKLRKLTRFGA